ncbi:hypothetical protein BU14_2176s0002, partial [Porphyra umbilicalis]
MTAGGPGALHRGPWSPRTGLETVVDVATAARSTATTAAPRVWSDAAKRLGVGGLVASSLTSAAILFTADQPTAPRAPCLPWQVTLQAATMTLAPANLVSALRVRPGDIVRQPSFEKGLEDTAPALRAPTRASQTPLLSPPPATSAAPPPAPDGRQAGRERQGRAAELGTPESQMTQYTHFLVVCDGINERGAPVVWLNR